jgi:hypothetical protein
MLQILSWVWKKEEFDDELMVSGMLAFYSQTKLSVLPASWQI